MSAPASPPQDAELHAYADGLLAPGRRAAVIAYLAARADETERVLGWQRQNELLRAAFPPAGPAKLVSNPHDADAPLAKVRARPAAGQDSASALRLLSPAQTAPAQTAAALGGPPARRRSGAALVHAASLLIAGLVIFLIAAQFSGSSGLIDRLSPLRVAALEPGGSSAPVPDGLARRALEAHAVFAEDRETPVEFDAAAPGQLLAYLTRRSGASVHAPNLTPQGLRLLGGRVLPLAGGVAAMLVYDAGAGQRMALSVARIAAAGDTGLRFQQTDMGAVHSVRWMTGDEIYVLTSEASRADTLKLAAAAAAGVEAARGGAAGGQGAAR